MKTKFDVSSVSLFLGIISVVACLTNEGAFGAAVRHSPSGLTIELGQDWREIPKNVPVKFLLACTNPKCGNATRAFVNTNFNAKLKRMRAAEFLAQIPQHKFPSLVKQMMGRLARVETTLEVKRSMIGGKHGYIGKFYLRYYDGRKRYLNYALTFDRGWFYHFQIFGDQGFEAAVDKYGHALFSRVSIRQ